MRRAVLVIALLALAAVPAQAADCIPGRTEADVDTDPANTGIVPRYYVVNDGPNWCCLVSIWIYQEANGIDGLQRDDEVVDDTCRGQIPGDLLVF